VNAHQLLLTNTLTVQLVWIVIHLALSALDLSLTNAPHVDLMQDFKNHRTLVRKKELANVRLTMRKTTLEYVLLNSNKL
jgi:hypothetical protein